MTFPSPAVMSPTKLSLAGNNLIFPGQGELGLGTGKMANLFFTVYERGGFIRINDNHQGVLLSPNTYKLCT